jgi:uncharacterized membrane protein YfhO
MKKLCIGVVLLALGASCSLAEQQAMMGTIVSESSVACGTKKQNKKASTDILCQQYKVQAGTVEYLIRQEKPSNTTIIPANTPIEFNLNKNKMKFKANGKKYEYLVVGTSAISEPAK